MFELALSEWLLTPEYISQNWTEEKLLLMLEKRSLRLNKTFKPAASSEKKDGRLSNQDFFMKHGIKAVPLG